MPCSDSQWYDERMHLADKAKLEKAIARCHQLTRFLCELCNHAELKVNFSPELEAWWEEHVYFDTLRKAWEQETDLGKRLQLREEIDKFCSENFEQKPNNKPKQDNG